MASSSRSGAGDGAPALISASVRRAAQTEAAAAAAAPPSAEALARQQASLASHFWTAITNWINSTETTSMRAKEPRIQLPIVALVSAGTLAGWTTQLQDLGYVVSQDARTYTVALPE